MRRIPVFFFHSVRKTFCKRQNCYDVDEALILSAPFKRITTLVRPDCYYYRCANFHNLNGNLTLKTGYPESGTLPSTTDSDQMQQYATFLDKCLQ